MATEFERDLTILEYVVLGLISTGPQSGYSIITTFDEDVYRRWSASPGTIYPMLKRLEKGGIIAGELEGVHETRPRKVYRLLPAGERLLDAWLAAAPTKFDVSEERDIALLKFLFAETRFPREDVLVWLDEYEQATNDYEYMFRTQRNPESEDWSLHQQLVVEASIMEINMLRTWIQLARSRLLSARIG
jgi:PadR family transcriptional regulator AphA